MVTFERPRPELGTEDEVVRKRIVAFLIDAIAFVVVWGILSTVIGSASETLAVLTGAVGGGVFFVYLVYFEAEYGQTIGKMLLNIVVVTEDGDPISYRESALRMILRIVDVLPVFYVIGLVAIYVTDRKQRLGDIVADTVVVEAKEKAEKL